MTLRDTKVKVEKLQEKQDTHHEQLIKHEGRHDQGKARQDRHTEDMKEGFDAMSTQMSDGFMGIKKERAEDRKDLIELKQIVDKHQPIIDDAVEFKATKKMLLNNVLKYGTILTVGFIGSLIYQHFTMLPK